MILLFPLNSKISSFLAQKLVCFLFCVLQMAPALMEDLKSEFQLLEELIVKKKAQNDAE